MLDQNTDRMWYVIGAVIVGAAIIFLVNNSFPQLFASVGDTFKDKTEDVSKVVDGIVPKFKQSVHEDNDLIHIMDTSMYQARTGVDLVVDETGNPLTKSPIMDLTYHNGSDGERTGTNDFVLWFSLPYTNSITEQDTLEVQFYARADKPMQLGTRLGAMFYGPLQSTAITTEWQQVTLRLPVKFFEDYIDKDEVIKGAAVFWANTPSKVSISDLTVNIYIKKE